MNKLEKVDVDYKNFRVPDIYKNQYDYLFDNKIIYRGQGYYMTGKVGELKEDDNIVNAIVHGQKDYNVKIIFLSDKKIDVSCDCLYHKETNIYCKHVHALLVAIHMKKEINRLSEEFKNNINRIKAIQKDSIELLKESKQYIHAFYWSWSMSDFNKYSVDVQKMNEEFETGLNYKILHAVQDSFIFLNLIIDNYNSLLDSIENGKIEYAKIQERKKHEQWQDAFSFEMGPDEDQLYNYLDNCIESQDLSTLKKASNELKKKGSSTDAIDKAIKKKKQKSSWLGKAIINGAISGFFGGMINSNSNSSSDIMPWEQDYIDKGDYEPYQFEEEELEEDDFYNEDE